MAKNRAGLGESEWKFRMSGRGLMGNTNFCRGCGQTFANKKSHKLVCPASHDSAPKRRRDRAHA